MMIAIVESNQEEIGRLCARYRVERLDLFGSAAQGRFDPAASDLDFLVRFQTLSPAEHADCYFGLLEALASLFGRRVDLVEAEPIENPYFRAAIEQTREVVYAP